MQQIWAILFLSALVLHAQNNPPLTHAHSHNDYQQKRPLLDALDRQFCSIEADVHLTNGQLLVAHDLKDVLPERSLENLYLAPLLKRVRENAGRVYRDGPPVVLLVDIKSELGVTCAALQTQLSKYSEMLTKFSAGKIETNAVTVILTGRRSVELMSRETNRLAACDGLLSDLDSNLPSALVPWISAEWRKSFVWLGDGAMPAEEKLRLRQLVEKTHRQGRQLRFWGTPDRPEIWRELRSAQVDWIGADDLGGLEKFLRSTE
ncbi:MAG: phosphatidylinositol-specific phospholipase C/glycerophosphodiester phosphodiesterase family protein [Verrucomicrobiota bacterium]